MINKGYITVGIPFYKKTIIEEFILSVDSILNQSLKPYEIHFIQDGDIDSNLNLIIKEYLSKYDNIRLIKLEKGNVAKSLNQSIQLAATKYYARMDSDDISMLERFEKQYNFLENNNNIDVVGSWAIEFNQNHLDPNNFIRKMPKDYLNIIKFYQIF